MRRRIAALNLILAVCLGPMVPWSAAAADGVDILYVSGPAGPFTGWTQPVLLVRAGDTVTYVNADAFQHDVVSTTVMGPDTDWCVAAKFAPGKCPLIWSPLIGVGETTKVYGLENLKPGQQVPFVCTLHGAMKGTLMVAPEAPASA